MPNLALLDLVAPYVLRGENLGAQHAALAVIRVVSFDTASDDLGIVFRGRCELNGRAAIDTTGGGLRILAATSEAAPPYDPNRQAPVFDIRETTIDFEIFVPRMGSQIIGSGAQTINAAGFKPTQDVFDVWDTLPVDAGLSDYPSSGFTLDLLLTAPSLRPPFMHPAKLNDQGLLMPDTSVQEVSIHLPRLRFRLAHGNGAGSQLTFDLVSAGSTSLDDPGDIGVAELISMEPPYAFLGDVNDRVFGIGFRSATLDLSSDSTPPALMSKAGVGDDWTGLYLPEVRIFFAPNGARDFAFEAGAHELLIGFGPGDGVWGDFEAMLVNQGSGVLKLDARFIGADGKAYGLERSSDTEARARIPARSNLVVDVSGGRTPYTRKVRVNGGAEQSGAAFNIDVSEDSPQDIVINVSDTSTPVATATLTIHVERRSATPQLATPGPAVQPRLVARLNAAPDTPKIIIAAQDDTSVTLTTEPADPDMRWQVDGGAEGSATPSLTLTVKPGENHVVKVRKPGSAVPPLPFYFYFNKPDLPDASIPPDEAGLLKQYADIPGNVSTQLALNELPVGRIGPDQAPMDAYKRYFDRVPPGAAIKIRGHASFENDNNKRTHNYHLARRRASIVRELIRDRYGERFVLSDIIPNPDLSAHPQAVIDAWATATNWTSHGGSADVRKTYWLGLPELPAGLNTTDDTAQGTVTRPAAPPPPPVTIEPVDPPVPAPETPDWFRSVKLKVRMVRGKLIAGEIEAEIDFQTATERKLQDGGQLPPGATAPKGHTLANGVPVGPDNPADGITKFRLLCQSDPGTGRITTLMSVGADPADKDGLGYFGWMPGETPPFQKDMGLTLLGAYLSFWPLLVEASKGGHGEVMDGVLIESAAAIPALIALMPKPEFRVERLVLYGAEYLQRDRGPEFEGHLLFDIGIDWSANILDLITIEPEHPLSIRYKAIGLRFGNRADDGKPQFVLRPVFDSSRGYSIDLANGGALKIAPPLGQILRVLGARLSRTNPLTFEIDIGLGVDLGVVSIDRASVRVYLDEARPPELTALGASVDIPGALVGSGYMQIGSTRDPQGNAISTVGGQIDLTLRPLNLRVAAALEIATIPAAAGGPATGVYVGLNVVLPVGLPLGTSGLGIFGFRGIFGMHYERNPQLGQGSTVPALAWLKAAGGKPHLLVNPTTQDKLWTPHVDRWSFGLGMLVGTMEGGVIMNLDGTLLLELPGPRVLIMMNARIISPPPGLDKMGNSGGILAVIEVTPKHFLIGILVQWDIERLIKIMIPIEAVFPFGDKADEWHIFLGSRSDVPPRQPVEVDVLGIVKGTGYLMFKGDGLPAYGPLPAIEGFGIGLGMASSFTWGNTDIGLYLRVGGGMDAVLGLDPFVLAGTVYVSGELRLFIVSIGADARLTVIVNEGADANGQPNGQLQVSIDGRACGHVSFLFFDVEGCVRIRIGSKPPAAPMPQLVDKLTLKSRSPALLKGSGVDRSMDGSLGDAVQQQAMPALNAGGLPVVPVDAIPVLSMKVPPVAKAGLKVDGLGTDVANAPGLLSDGSAERGGQTYRYELAKVALERVDPNSGTVFPAAIQGSGAPVVWWALHETTGSNATAQLALLTWEPTAATKAIEKNEHLEKSIQQRWGTVCANAAPAADLLWTFRWELPGQSPPGWHLEGMAWPDPPGTRRSTPPQTRLRVYERWRSGDGPLDVRRGIFPALVVGSLVNCWKPPGNGVVVGGLTGTPQLVVGGLGAISGTNKPPSGAAVALQDPVHAALVKSAQQVPLRISPALHAKVAANLATDAAMARAPAPTLAEVTRRLNQGLPVTRSQFGAAFNPLAVAPAAPASTAAATQPPQCTVRLLEAPLLDDGKPIAFGDPADEAFVKQRLVDLQVTHGPLNDVVVLETGGYGRLDLLLFVRRDLLEGQRVKVRTLDAAGTQIGLVAATSADTTPPKPLPAHWTDANGPWADDIAELLLFNRPGYLAVFLRLDKRLDAARVEIGTLGVPSAVGAIGASVIATYMPAYFVAAVGAIGAAEMRRLDWDNSQIQEERQVLTNMFGEASSHNALLFADSLYRITVQWSGKRTGDGTTIGLPNPVEQSFWFRTDRIDAVPATADKPAGAVFNQQPPLPVRLDSWLLLTQPADRERCTFGAENTRLVFNTHDVDRVFAAYGKELRVRFQAASSRHPKPTDVKHPYPLNAQTLVRTRGSIFSPWEDLAGQLMQATNCVPVDEERDRQSVLDIKIPLEPYTDYILDVEMVAAGAADDARGPVVLRRHFSTGAFATLDQFAATLQSVLISGRYCEPGAMEAVRAHFNGRRPQGAELDDQLRAQGLEPLAPPQVPRMVVFWQQQGNNLPQPAAVLIDAPEPLWRARPYPFEETDDTGAVTARRWVLADTDWLVLQDQSAAGVVAASGMIRAPGDQRALIVLAAGARGKTLKIDLVSLAFPALAFLNQTEQRATLFERVLDHAPWEEI